MPIQAILSDLDKTLIEDALVPEQVIRVVKTYLEVTQQKATRLVEDFYATQTTKAHYLNGYSKVGAWKTIFAKNEIHYSYTQLYELNDLFWKTAAEYARPYEGVIQTITSLKKHGYLFGIVSGGDYITRFLHLRQTDILHFADVVVTTEEIGHVKHGKNLYSVAADELGITYTNCLAIGDNEMADIVLPKEEGFVTVKVDPDTGPTIADFLVKKFSEIEGILQSKALTQQL